MQGSTTQNLVAALMLCTAPVNAWAADGIGPFEHGVPHANKAQGTPPNKFSADFTGAAVAVGTDPLENPSGPITKFGQLSDGTNTEPDQNTYLTFDGKVGGPTKGYDYGHHFLFQGHENAGAVAYVTRINLDVNDPAHRIVLLTPTDENGLTNLSRLDGSAYDPFTNSLLVTQEGSGSDGGLVEVSMGWPAKVTTQYGSMGRCGLEGVHSDDAGRIYLVEDTGGQGVSNDKNDINGPNKVAKQPNSYVFRFVPSKKSDLSAGRLEALQVSVDGEALVFGGTSAEEAFADVWSPKQVELHSGASFPTKWVTVHDTAADGTADFDCNLAARNGGATPFKRPENGAFKPDGSFRTFFFAITGDTNNLSGSVKGLAQRGAWGGLFQLDLDSKRRDGTIKLLVLGDAKHNSFDNVTFGDSDTILTSEDRGDTLHDQLNAFDSIWAYPLSDPTTPLRVVALGRDESAAEDGEEDNEPTGIYVSNGEYKKSNQYGTPANLIGARGFFTDQHGDNTIFELSHTGAGARHKR